MPEHMEMGISRRAPFFLPAQFPAQAVEFFLLAFCKGAHVLHDCCHMARQDFPDQSTSFLGKMNGHESAVLPLAPPLDKPPFLEVVNDHRDIPAAREKLIAEVTLAHRPEVKESFKYAKLTCRQTRSDEMGIQPRGHRPRCTHQLDVGVQGPEFVLRALVMSAHRSL